MSEIESLVAAMRASPKYRRLCDEIILHVGAAELRKRPSFKEAVKATKSTLHQVAGSYLDARMEYDGWSRRLREASASGSAESFKAVCKDVLRRQSSTRERLPIIDRFYVETLGPIAPVQSLLDLGSGLNPLASPWMPLAAGADYRAYDVYTDMAAFLVEFFRLAAVRGDAECCDVSQISSVPAAQVALMLKCVPVLDHLDRAAASRLIEGMDVPHILISFPLKSLGGRKKGMPATYEARMAALTNGKPWRVDRFEYETELAFLVSK